MSGGEVEPVAERRRRKTAREQLDRARGAEPADYRNSPTSADEADDLERPDESDDDRADALSSDSDGLYFDERTRA